jgi:hypothetical protein
VHQLGGVHHLDSLGGAVLPDVSEPEPDPHDAAPATYVRLRHGREPPHCAHDRALRPHVHRRLGHALDSLRGPPLRRDRPERSILGIRLPRSLSHRARRGLHVRVRYTVHRQGVGPARTERSGRVVPGDDADRLGDRRQRFYDCVQQRPQGAVKATWRRSGRTGG